MRNIVFRFDNAPIFSRVLQEGDQELGLPEGETVGDGEWVLAIFEIGKKRRATAAAARGLRRDPRTPAVVAFERRDWERLLDFASAGSTRMPVAPVVLPPEPPTEPSGLPPDFALEGEGDGAFREFPRESAAEAWRRGAEGPVNAEILLVDDDPDICKVTKAMLAAVGLNASSTANAEDALRRIREKPPDLVVLDWNLPGMTGLELCRIIRKDRVAWRLPVLFLTGNAEPDDIVRAFASGADDYVVKPFRGPELGARILSLLRRASVTQARS